MRVCFLCHILLCFLATKSKNDRVEAWSPAKRVGTAMHASKNNKNSQSLKVLQKCQAYSLSAAILLCAQIGIVPIHTSSYCHAAPDISFAANLNLERTLEAELNSPDGESRTMSSSSKKLMQSLSRPTDEMPQIKPPTSAMDSNSKVKQPILEGMVYMADEFKNDRPDPSEIIILTVSSVSEPNEILAGAKYPVYKARMPFNFKMYDANILKNKMGQFRTIEARGEDFIVVARVCPGDDNTSAAPVCDARESTYQGKGVGKLLQVPGMQEGEIIRTPASLALEKNRSL